MDDYSQDSYDDDAADITMGYGEPASGLGDGGLSVGGLTLPPSLTDPSLQPQPDPTVLPPSVYDPVPPAPEREPETIPQKAVDWLLTPDLTPPSVDPYQVEQQEQDAAGDRGERILPVHPPGKF